MNMKLVADKANPATMKVPNWGTSMADFCHLLGHDQSQTLIAFSVNNCLALAILDTGACRTVMSPDYVDTLGLKVTKAINGNYKPFGVPGSGIIHDYAWVMADPFELWLGKDVNFTITDLKLIANPYPLALLGVDVLKAGRPSMWNHLGTDLMKDCTTRVLKF